MINFNIYDCYDHQKLLQECKEFETRLRKEEQKLAKMKPQTTTLKENDIVEATGKGTVIEGVKGKITSIEKNGKFLSFLIDWDFAKNTKKHYKTCERLQDIRFFKKR